MSIVVHGACTPDLSGEEGCVSANKKIKKQPGGQQLSREDTLGSDGPTRLAFIVGYRSGRWQQEVTSPLASGETLKNMLFLGAAPKPCAHSQVLGIARLVSYQPLLGGPTDDTPQAFVAAADAIHKKCGALAFLQHPILAAASLSAPLMWRAEWERMPSSRAVRELWQACANSNILARVTRDSSCPRAQSMTVSKIIGKWSKGLSDASPM